MQIFKLPLILAMALALVLPAYRGPASVGPAHNSVAAATPAVTVWVGCYTNPEYTRVRNNKTTGIYIKQVTSIYKPYSPEPFYMNRWLGAGKTVTFQTGAAATTNRLTLKYIYNNSVGTQEGAKVVTSVGTFYDRCG